jgi:purine-nucleoside/S-methyl-5'-thioadenosine phosphorylase / adenosine deaminase
VFAYRARLGRVEVAFTDRHGGVSPAPYDSLNLGSGSGDQLSAVETNFERVLQAFGAGSAELRRMRQVHGPDVAVVDTAPAPDAGVDGMVTGRGEVVLCVRAADCAPVLLADERHGVIGCAHAGREGLAVGVVPAVVAKMRQLGADRVTAWVGPHICGRCYEVPEPLRAKVAAAVPLAAATTRHGTPALDIGAGVRSQLEAAGCTVTEVAACTFESPDLFSYRREGPRSGRAAGLIRMTQ